MIPTCARRWRRRHRWGASANRTTWPALPSTCQAAPAPTSPGRSFPSTVASVRRSRGRPAESLPASATLLALDEKSVVDERLCCLILSGSSGIIEHMFEHGLLVDGRDLIPPPLTDAEIAELIAGDPQPPD